MGFGLGVLWVVSERELVDEDVIQKWKDIEPPVWYISIPLAIIYLAALVYVGWYFTSIVYFIGTLINWLLTYLLFSSIKELKQKADPLAFIKNPEVKEAILKSRKPIIGVYD